MHRFALVNYRIILVVLVLELIICPPAYADEGVPDELLNKNSEARESESDSDPDLDEKSDENEVDQDEADEKEDLKEREQEECDNDEERSGPVHQIRQGGMLEGRADLNHNPREQMPPVAPPIRRVVNPPFPMQVQQNTTPLNLTSQSPQPDDSQPTSKLSALKNIFELGASKNYGPIVRPNWIPGHAYTNQSMVAPYHNRDIAWWDKSKMPDRPQWVILSTSVTRYWRGYAPNPCWIIVAPNPLAPGNFTFRSKVPNGPRGWLQDINRTSKFGFPLYRYWLDQPGFR